jgi:hypothetical protein
LESAFQVVKEQGAEKVIITSQLETEFGKLNSNLPSAPVPHTLGQITDDEQLPVGDVSVVVVTVLVVVATVVVVVAVVVVGGAAVVVTIDIVVLKTTRLKSCN